MTNNEILDYNYRCFANDVVAYFVESVKRQYLATVFKKLRVNNEISCYKITCSEDKTIRGCKREELILYGEFVELFCGMDGDRLKELLRKRLIEQVKHGGAFSKTWGRELNYCIKTMKEKDRTIIAKELMHLYDVIDGKAFDVDYELLIKKERKRKKQ